MDTKIHDIQIQENAKGYLSIQFWSSDPREKNNTESTFKKLTLGSKKQTVGNVEWYEIHKEVICRLGKKSEMFLIEIQDIGKSNSSSLLLVPIILFDQEIISEQQKISF